MKKTPYEKEWKQIDSLSSKGLVKTAEKKVEALLRRANADKQSIEILKAQRWLVAHEQTENQDKALEHLVSVEKTYVHNARMPEKAIWLQGLAGLYQDYVNNYAYRFASQSSVATSCDSLDISEWGARQFAEKIQKLYTASLSDEKALQTDVEPYKSLFEGESNTWHLRSTLYENLVFNAISYFKGGAIYAVQNNIKAYIIKDPKAFATGNSFIQNQWQPTDTLALAYNVLKLYQELEAYQSKKASRASLLDAQLLRLEWVYKESAIENKSSLYSSALEQLIASNKDLPAIAEAYYQLLVVKNEPYNITDTKRAYAGEKDLQDYQVKIKSVIAELERIIKTYPGTYGASRAQALLNSIQSRSLNIETESVVLPGAYNKFLLKYRNIEQVYIRVIKAKEQSGKFRNNNNWDSLNNYDVVQEWTETLPGFKDYKEHAADVKIEPLQTGWYKILVSDKAFTNYSDPQINNYRAIGTLIVSNLAYLSKNNEIIVVHRKTGAPVANAQVGISERNTSLSTVKKWQYTDKNGRVQVKKDKNYYNSELHIRSNDDYLQNTIYLYDNKEYDPTYDTKKVLLFLDRAIYRPGQTVYFKGILYEPGKRMEEAAILSDKGVDIKLKDVNNQEIETLRLTTNEFGSFNGSFRLPAGLLTGTFTIECSYGSTWFQVEEYKRPKFQIIFDTLQKVYSLNDTIEIEGKSVAYAGNPLSTQKVNYRIERRVHFPFYWLYRKYMPSDYDRNSTVIHSGETSTGKDGQFKIAFPALPQENINKEALPNYTFTVYVDIMDDNGETQSKEQSLTIGSRSLFFDIALPERTKKLQELSVTTNNINNVFVQTNTTLNIYTLEAPGQYFRERILPKADAYLITPNDYKNYFPLDAYKNEDQKENWPTGGKVYERTFTSTKDGIVKLPGALQLKPGHYLFEFKARDAKGKEVTEKKYLEIYAPAALHQLQSPFVDFENTVYDYGEKVPVRLLSPFLKSNWLVQIDNEDAYWTVLNDGNYSTILSTDYKYRDGRYIDFVTIIENRLYRRSAHINVKNYKEKLDIAWATHRDNLEPNTKDKWTFTISGKGKEKLAAEMLAGLYDASLDALTGSPLSYRNFELYYRSKNINHYANYNFLSNVYGTSFHPDQKASEQFIRSYPYLNFQLSDYGYRRRSGRVEKEGNTFYEVQAVANMPTRSTEAVLKTAPAVTASRDEGASASGAGYEMDAQASAGTNEEPKDIKTDAALPEIAVRKNLNELAFFYPALRTDKNGSISFEFTMPEALTQWRLMAFAHNQKLESGFLTGLVRTQKTLMIQPNMPRFAHQGDKLVLMAKISNLSDSAISGRAAIKILDAITNADITADLVPSAATTTFKAEAKGTTSVQWHLQIPATQINPLIVRVKAAAGNFSDGEENIIPVLSNKILMTESLPLWMNGNGQKTYHWDKLAQAGQSKTLQHQGMTVEYTGNPVWNIVQSLPYLMEYPYECAEQTFNKYFANRLSSLIVAQSPKIRTIFDKWKSTDTTALLSSLSKNEELKSALLEETPWVFDAESETKQKQNIALLFDTYKVEQTAAALLGKLEKMLNSDGALPWFSGMRSDWFISQYVALGMARLHRLGAAAKDERFTGIQSRLNKYVALENTAYYTRLLNDKKADTSKLCIGALQVQYLYLRSFQPRPLVMNETEQAYAYFLKQAKQYWTQFSPQLQGMLAIVFHRGSDKALAKTIMQSLSERAIRNEELGMYWKIIADGGFYWYQSKIEAHAMMIEAFSEVAKDTATVDLLKLWLIKQKQTNRWSNTKATADACYAMLATGSSLLNDQAQVRIKTGSRLINSKELQQEAGTGYFKEIIPANAINAENAAITLEVKDNTSASWGAVYWQYFEQLDKISAAASPLAISRQLYKFRVANNQKALMPLQGNNTQLKVGDLVTIRVYIKADRDMEYVHLKDMRAACFEPVSVLSGYRYQNGLGYYESTRDASTNFFIDRLPKGNYMLEYDVRVNSSGTFSNGISSIQSMYAPEFTSHTAGGTIVVGEP